MTRPLTVQDVFDALAHNRLVEPARLRAFVERHTEPTVRTVLERLVADGLLTAFQAGEVAGGRGAGLWLGAYRKLDRLGRGGMGHVFLAEHAVLGRRVAVKALSDALRADPGARKRFVREARAAAALDHPNIVRVFDVNMTNDPPYLVMEYVDGVSFQAAVSQTGTFSAGEAAAVGLQVADGLAQAAVVGLVHRDIKPANLLVDRCGKVKILDLGIVRFTQEDTHSRVNGQEIILGTLDYLAPEQAEDCSKVDARADLYSLGATLYFLIAGHPPYPVADLRQKLKAKQDEDPPPLYRLRPDVSPEFSAVVARLMARNPAGRYPSAATVVAALHPWATLGPNFPARLFRTSSDTTTRDRRLTTHEPSRDAGPETLRIIKPLARQSVDAATAEKAAATGHREPVAPVPVADPEIPLGSLVADDPAADTQVAGVSALTDEALAIPADLVAMALELAPPTTAPPVPERPLITPTLRRSPAGGSFWVFGLILAALILLAGAAGLIALFGR